MYLLEVIPIARGITKETLSYFSKTLVPRGEIVFVPLRKRTVPALVLAGKEVKDAKQELRKSNFALRKISARKPRAFLPQAFIDAASETAEYSASSVGSVLHTILPQALLSSLETSPVRKTKKKRSAEAQAPSKKIFQAESLERIARYKSLIRESFAGHKSVFIVVPTIADVNRLKEELTRGIEEYSFCFHSGLSKKYSEEHVVKALSLEHPVLIVGTPGFISLCRDDIGTLILEKERSRAYKLPHRPHIDMRLFVERYAHHRGLELIFADLPVRLETYWRYSEHEFQDLMPPKMRFLSSAETKLIDMRQEPSERKDNFAILSGAALNMVKRTIEQGERCFLFTARRGLASTIVCEDCGSIVMSEDKTVPMALQKAPQGKNMFVSFRTGEMRSAHERCKVCTGWKLKALGVGIERVEEALQPLIGKQALFRIDKDTTPTHRKAAGVAKAFYSTHGAVLLGTELALPYLTHPLQESAIVSLDSLLALPEWRVTERVFGLILTLRENTTKTVLLQTRKGDTETLSLALAGNISEFFKRETELRREFAYPPFSVLVKISVGGTPAATAKEMEQLHTRFTEDDIHLYPTPLATAPGRVVRHALLRIRKEEWPAPNLLKKLRALPPQFAVDVDPENLL